MTEYTFLGSNGFRSKHFKAENLRQAKIYAKVWAINTPGFGKITGSYQTAKEGDFVMSGWKQTKI